jgi:hypothetical protein
MVATNQVVSIPPTQTMVAFWRLDLGVPAMRFGRHIYVTTREEFSWVPVSDTNCDAPSDDHLLYVSKALFDKRICISIQSLCSLLPPCFLQRIRFLINDSYALG